MNKNIDLDNSSSSYLSNKSETSSQIKSKQRYYYLYKKGGKYLIKKKSSKPNSTKRILQFKKESNITNIETRIKSLFNYKYTKINEYNTIIINDLIYNIPSRLVTCFQENLIIDDKNEFLYRFYEKKKIEKILKKLLNYYEKNNVIYPNYISLYEGNYIFNNIEQKQKIIDRQEKRAKRKEEKKEINNKEEKILNSNVVDSILNQTNTSETKRVFGLKDDNTLFEDDDLSQINILINNIDNIEKNGNKNKIFHKKSLIRIKNDNSNKDRNSMDISNNKNKKNSYIKELLSTISYFKKSKIKSKFGEHNQKKTISHNDILSNINYNNNSVIKRSLNFNNLKIHKRINTLDTIKVRPKTVFFSNNNNNSLNNSDKSIKSPYYVKRPINMDNITYSKKKIIQNLSERNNSNSNKHKNSRSINNYNNTNFQLDSDYFNLDNNFNRMHIYKKKLNIIDTENKLNQNTKKENNELNNIKASIINKPKINYRQLSIQFHPNVSSNKINNKNLYDSKYKYTRVSPSPNFKILSKMIKTKYLFDDKLKNKTNSNPLTARSTINNFNIKYNKTNIGKDENKNYTTKNIYISNNITNNNFYTINDGKKKNMKLLIYRNIKNNEINKKNKNKIHIKEYKLDKYGNLYIKTENGNLKKHQTNLSNNINMNKDIDNSRNLNKRNIINKYKNGLINSTTLKSLDKYSLNSLLNKFRLENANSARNTSHPNNSIKYTTINEMNNKNRRY